MLPNRKDQPLGWSWKRNDASYAICLNQLTGARSEAIVT
jgi:hypothetical protein